MIFLSAGVPSPTPIKGRKYFGPGNVPAIRESIMAFTKVCMEYNISFCFGGHPAISPLVYQVGKEYSEGFANNIKIYQSEWFMGQTPEEVSYYKNIVWTPKGDGDLKAGLAFMRKEMLENALDCAVFIGGMDGIIEEARMFKERHPDAKMLALPNTGGATSRLKQETGLDLVDFPDSYAYVSLFREFLKCFETECHKL